MSALKDFVAQRNEWNAMFKGAQYELDTPAGRQRVADLIDASLSPENLTCDGELSRAEVKARYNRLITVAKELQDLDPGVKFYEFG